MNIKYLINGLIQIKSEDSTVGVGLTNMFVNRLIINSYELLTLSLTRRMKDSNVRETVINKRTEAMDKSNVSKSVKVDDDEVTDKYFEQGYDTLNIESTDDDKLTGAKDSLYYEMPAYNNGSEDSRATTPLMNSIAKGENVDVDCLDTHENCYTGEYDKSTVKTRHIPVGYFNKPIIQPNHKLQLPIGKEGQRIIYQFYDETIESYEEFKQFWTTSNNDKIVIKYHGYVKDKGHKFVLFNKVYRNTANQVTRKHKENNKWIVDRYFNKSMNKLIDTPVLPKGATYKPRGKNQEPIIYHRHSNNPVRTVKPIILPRDNPNDNIPFFKFNRYVISPSGNKYPLTDEILGKIQDGTSNMKVIPESYIKLINSKNICPICGSTINKPKPKQVYCTKCSNIRENDRFNGFINKLAGKSMLKVKTDSLEGLEYDVLSNINNNYSAIKEHGSVKQEIGTIEFPTSKMGKSTYLNLDKNVLQGKRTVYKGIKGLPKSDFRKQETKTAPVLHIYGPEQVTAKGSFGKNKSEGHSEGNKIPFKHSFNKHICNKSFKYNNETPEKRVFEKTEFNPDYYKYNTVTIPTLNKYAPYYGVGIENKITLPNNTKESKYKGWNDEFNKIIQEIKKDMPYYNKVKSYIPRLMKTTPKVKTIMGDKVKMITKTINRQRTWVIPYFKAEIIHFNDNEKYTPSKLHEGYPANVPARIYERKEPIRKTQVISRYDKVTGKFKTYNIIPVGFTLTNRSYSKYQSVNQNLTIHDGTYDDINSVKVINKNQAYVIGEIINKYINKNKTITKERQSGYFTLPYVKVSTNKKIKASGDKYYLRACFKDNKYRLIVTKDNYSYPYHCGECNRGE